VFSRIFIFAEKKFTFLNEVEVENLKREEEKKMATLAREERYKLTASDDTDHIRSKIVEDDEEDEDDDDDDDDDDEDDDDSDENSDENGDEFIEEDSKNIR
jgi:hypothetical protein